MLVAKIHHFLSNQNLTQSIHRYILFYSDEAIPHIKLTLPLYNPDERDGYATLGTPHTYVILDNAEAGKLEKTEDASHQYEVIAAHSKVAAENRETIYLKPFN